MHFKLKVNFDQISNCENDTESQIWNTYFHMVCFEYLWDSKPRSGKDSRCLTRPGLEPNIRNIQVPCTTNHHHWGGHHHSCCIYRGLAVLKQQPSKYSLSPFASTKNVQGQNIPDNVLSCSLSGSVAKQLILIVQAQKPRTEFRPRRKALRGKKSSFKMPFLIIASSDTLLLIRRTSSCPWEESSCTVHKVKGGSSAIESEVHMHPDFDFLWKLFRGFLVS